MSCDAVTQTAGKNLEASPKVLTNLKTECQDVTVEEASEIYNFMIDWISNVNHSPMTVSNCIKWAKKCIEMFPENNKDAVEEAKINLVRFAAEYLAKKRPDKISENWGSIIEDVTNLISEFDPEWKGYLDISKEFIEWVLAILNTPKAWQRAKLHLKVMWFIYIFPKDTFSDLELGSRAACGLIKAGVQLQVNMLNPDGPGIYPIRGNQFKLDIPLHNVIEKLRKFGHIQILVNSAVDQLKNFKPGVEVKFVANIAKLAGNFSKYVANSGRLKNRHPFTQVISIMILRRNISIFKIVAGDSPFVHLLQMPGMCQIASSALITIIDNILSNTDLCIDKKECVETLMLDLDSFFRHLIAIKKVFQEDHDMKLREFQTKLNELNLSLPSMPEPILKKEMKNCPTKFLDALTQNIMKAPVCLSDSVKVIDESTLIQLLLDDAPKDPFTHSPLESNSFVRLPGLKKEIQEWFSSQYSA